MSDPTEIAGYRVLSRLGEGAASVIYAVQDPRSKQVYALKEVDKRSEKDQRFIEQTEAEYAVGSKLDHPRIRHLHRLVRHRKRFKVTGAALVMELVDADTLDHLPAMTDRDAVPIFIDVADGLAHMHARGFVHADMKPNNVMVEGDGHAKIIDLGQACRIGTVKKRIQGTPGYMAPEQAHREAITPKTDIYNFGATMYWVLVRDVIPTALPPADDRGIYTGALDADQVEDPVPPHERNDKIHPLLSKQIMDCVKVDPDARPESMEFVKNRLELILDVLQPKASASTS